MASEIASPASAERTFRRLPFALVLLLPAIVTAAGYTTYIGDGNTYHVFAMTTDASGNTYLTGARQVGQTPANLASPPLTDVFVTKLDPSGNLLATFTLSGKGSDQGNGIAVDPSGNIWVTGVSSSPDFPTHNPLQATLGGGRFATGFLTKLSPDGTILFSTYFGGTQGGSALNSIAVDTNGNAYVTGTTSSPDFPYTAGLPNQAAGPGLGGHTAAVFAKISAAGDKILYAGGIAADTHQCGAGSTCFLSTIYSTGVSIAVDASGSAYIAGNTTGTGLPTTPGALRTDGIGAFVLKVKPDGGGLVYLTLLGSANFAPNGFVAPANIVTGIAADSAGNAYITGYTSDPDFPATSASLQPVYSIPALQVRMAPFELSPPDAFAAKLNPSGTAMVWASFLGGAKADQGNAIAVDPAGDVWISGTTSSSDFPTSAGVPQGTNFLVEFNPDGSALAYGSRFPADTVSTALTLDSSGALHAAGDAGLVSVITPSQISAPYMYGIANSASGPLSGRLAPSELISIYGQNFGVTTPAQGTFDSSGFLPTTLAGVQVTIGGIPAPLLYISDSQINAIVPSGVTHGATQVVMTLGGSSLPAFRALVVPADPQIFLNSDGSAAAVNQDGSLNSAAHPAPPGSIVSIWATGTGASGPDGQRDTTVQYNCGCYLAGISNVTTGVTYAGPAPGLPNGVTQINFQIRPAAMFMQSLVLSVDGASSNQTFVYISR